MLIEPDDARALRESCVFIDTRDSAVFRAGHIPGAVNIREIFTYETTSSPESLKVMQQKFAELFGRAGLTSNKRAIVYEDAMDNGNGQSCRGAFLLKYLGHSKVSVLHGGLKGWRAAGFGLSSDFPVPSSCTFHPIVDISLLVTKDAVIKAIRDPSVVLLDVRDTPEWRGETAAPCTVTNGLIPGRIPGAVWMAWRELIDSEQEVPRFKSAELIVSLCARSGITPSSNIVIYCYKGSRAASTWLALKSAGFNHVSNYFPSWAEWGLQADAPIETLSSRAIFSVGNRAS